MILPRVAMLALLWAALGSSACSSTDPLVAVPPTLSAPLSVSLPTRTPVPDDTGWRAAGEGIETRELAVNHQEQTDRLFMARVEPSRAAFRVRYNPELPRRVGEWLESERAQLIVNGGFFTPDHRALGLLITDGAPVGESYEGRGGLFGVSGDGVQVRSLILQPYRLDEVFDQMVQSFPMLLIGNGALNDQIQDDGGIAPRTVVALDRQGRVVFLVSPRATFSLLELAVWLAQSDLDLDTALNLDGGTSSGLMVQTAEGRWGIDSWVRVPAVIAIP
ncbi:MAG TPA: phosphodiester glycosidase family protein [Anaerolineae bacterium]|nr:phosphodiester glycosidase family protein [Anaerolineae bacterium]